MAEKEDYIVISKKDFNYKKEHYVTHLATQMTRQEAIERMEKAMKQYAKDEEIYTDKDLDIVALNALLEGK